MIASCRLHGEEPYACLKDVLTRLPGCTGQEVAQLAPQRWQESRSAALQQAA